MRVITFSRTFPAYHPKAGQPTYFVEQIYNSLCSMNLPMFDKTIDPPIDFIKSLTCQNVGYKHHTIRAGHRWKVGDWFSPRIWSGKPYNSKQIQFAPPIQIKKIWDFAVDSNGVCAMALAGENLKYLEEGIEERIAQNDGLSLIDFEDWIVYPVYYSKNRKPFDGQIICWDESIEY